MYAFGCGDRVVSVSCLVGGTRRGMGGTDFSGSVSSP